MKFTIATVLAIAGLACAQDVQSKPFQLILSSANKTYDGQKLSSCHSGAAIEALCWGKSGSNYYFNTTKGDSAIVKGYTPSGVLNWNLPLGNGPPESEPLSFYYDPSTNVAEALFQPSYDSIPLAFNSATGQLKVVSYLDDTKNPPTESSARLLDNWYICQTEYLGYNYYSLAWTVGPSTAKPQNPTCTKVEVKRKFN